MLKASGLMLSFNDLLLPYRGNWNLPWVIQRYWRTFISGVTVNKLANAILAMIEMNLGKIHVKSKPFVLRIEPTNFCNLRCPRCSCGIATDPRKKGYLAMDDCKLVFEQNRQNTLIVRLDGNGEQSSYVSGIQVNGV